MNIKLLYFLIAIVLFLWIIGCRKELPVEIEQGTIDNVNAFITITSPQTGDTFKPGDWLQIRWGSSTSIDRIKIELYNNNVLRAILTDHYLNSGVYQWGIPFAMPLSNKYKLRIISTRDTSIYSYSGTFKIINQ
ncbi:MAG: hypothetical protein C4539_16240 [Ignavibacteriales bacterium]|nr:MAG: hypothetical protein C4539_16240 [Ignavibacteriales bacterium]